MIQVYTEVSVSVCSTNIVFYINFSVTVGIQSQNLERILQKKLNWCDPKRKRGTVTMWGQKEKWQITSRAHSEPYLNTWAGIYPRFHTFAYPLVNSHIILNVFTSAKGIWMLSTERSSLPLPPSVFQLKPPQGRDLCDRTCFQRQSGITGFSRARSLKLS